MTKQDIMNEISDTLAIPRHTVANGSTEPRAFLDDVAKALGLNPRQFSNKQVLAEAIAKHLGEEWDGSCDSREHAQSGGGTVTLEGLQRILRGLPGFFGDRNPRFAIEVNSALQRTPQMTGAPKGNPAPSRDTTDASGFRRSPDVAAWTLHHADGKCTLCNDPAPFRTKRGVPYLEVHHVRPLSEGGPDTVDNAVALCPNCHRKAHFSEDSSEIRSRLLDIVTQSPTHKC